MVHDRSDILDKVLASRANEYVRASTLNDVDGSNSIFNKEGIRNRSGRLCQRKIEMSYSLQSRNVLFCQGGQKVRGSLGVPVKRRRAMLASNPIKE